MDVSSNRCPGKEIVDGIQSRPDNPKLDVQVYNKEHHEGCSHEMVLYAENAIVPINASETMNGQETLGELENKNHIVDIGFLPSFEGRLTRSMSKNLPKDHNPFMKDANYWRTFTKSLVEHFQGSDSKIIAWKMGNGVGSSKWINTTSRWIMYGYSGYMATNDVGCRKFVLGKSTICYHKIS